MHIFRGENFTKMYYEALKIACHSEIPFIESRLGSMRDLGSAYFEIENDNLRLIYLNKRNLNPFLALMEFSWFISGSNLLRPLQYFVNTYDKFSDDGVTLNGAYGHRLRTFFGYDQIERAIEELKREPSTRRINLSLWAPEDLGKISNDLPCNTSIMLRIRNQKLDITIINRSNDIFLGLPYDIFLFYLLQVYISQRLGCPIGIQRHLSNCLHLYQVNQDEAISILNNNTNSGIEFVQNKLLKHTHIEQYLLEDHKKISDLNFESINHLEPNAFYRSYSLYKKRSYEDAIKFLPRDLLGFIAYSWFLSRPSFPEGINHKYYDDLKERLMMKQAYTLESVKSRSITEIVTVVNEVASKNIQKFEELLSIINANRSIFSVDSERLDKQKFIQAAVLSLILDSIADNSDPYLRSNYLTKVREVCVNLNILYDDVTEFLRYREQLMQLVVIE